MKPKISIFAMAEGEKRLKFKSITTNYYLTTIALDPNNNYSKTAKKYYNVVNVKTEKQLLWWLYNSQFTVYRKRKKTGKTDIRHFSFKGKTTRVILTAHKFGPGRIYSFWKGWIGPDGFKMDNKVAKFDDIKYIKELVDEATDDEEHYIFESDYQDEKKDIIKQNKQKKYGFVPYLIPSGKRGFWNAWEDPDMAFDKDKIQKKEMQQINKKIKFEDMTIDDLNNF